MLSSKCLWARSNIILREARELGVFISILEVIVGSEEVREITQGLKAPLWQSWDLNAGLTTLRVKTLNQEGHADFREPMKCEIK